MSSPDPERVREARDALRKVYNKAWGDVTFHELDDATYAALQVLDEVLAGSSPDYEAAALAVFVVDMDAKRDAAVAFSHLTDYTQNKYLEIARAAVAAAFPGLFEERP